MQLRAGLSASSSFKDILMKGSRLVTIRTVFSRASSSDSMRVNSKYNAQANRELRRLAKSTLSNDELFDKMENYFEMQFKDAGAGDTMTREELWFAILDIRDARVCDVCGSAS